jgi:hypothetical protein
MKVVNNRSFITLRAMNEHILNAVRKNTADGPRETFVSRMIWACADIYTGEQMGIIILPGDCFYLNKIAYCNFFGMNLDEFDDFCDMCFFMCADLQDMCSISIRGGAWEKYRLARGHHFPWVSDSTFCLEELTTEAYNELGVSHVSVDEVIYGR